MTSPLRMLVAVAALSGLSSAPAGATPWPYPGEISIADAYDRLYGTRYAGNTFEGLTSLVHDHGVSMAASWTTQDFDHLEVLVYDTSARTSLRLVAGGLTIGIYDPGPWKPPTRGWLPDIGSAVTIDLAALLVANGLRADERFSLAVGGVPLNASNTYALSGLAQRQWLYGYNEGGLQGGDRDGNEPLFCVSTGLTCTDAARNVSPGVVVEPASLPLSLLGLGLLLGGRLSTRPSRLLASR